MKTPSQQHLWERLLKLILPFYAGESVIGDYDEMVSRIAKEKGSVRAQLWILGQIVKSVIPFLLDTLYWELHMIKNYLRIAFRNMRRRRLYSAINVVGLALGMTLCLLILLWIRDELSYDRYHEKAHRIVRLVDSIEREGGTHHLAWSSAPFAPMLKREFAEVEETVRLMPVHRRLVEYEEKRLYEDDLVWADPSIFRIFTLPLVSGVSETALEDPLTVVICEGMAKKYFGDDDPIGKTLTINGSDYRITGVMEDMPNQSHFWASGFLSMRTLEGIESFRAQYFQSWAKHEFYTYILLRESLETHALEAKLPDFIERHAATQLRTILGCRMVSHLQPLTRIHLHSNRYGEFRPTGNMLYVTLFSAVAMFVLLIACFNYMNLSTALFIRRSREVGLRKVVGGFRRQIVFQLLGEAFLFSALSAIAALGLAGLILPFFNGLTGKTIILLQLAHPSALITILGVIAVVGSISGLYPALILSRMQPADMMKGRLSANVHGHALRKMLIILQFAVSIALIVVTLIVSEQIDFLKNRKLGFDKEHVLIVPIRSQSIRSNHESVKEDLLRYPRILSATISIGVPGGVVAGDAIDFMTPEGIKRHTVRMFYADHDFVKTMGLDILEGRDFDKAMKTDAQSAIIVNEALMRLLEKKHPEEIEFLWGAGDPYEKRGRAIGVVRDFQYTSLKEEIAPLVIHIFTPSTRLFAIRVRPENLDETIRFVKNVWEELDPANPFEYHFMDETFDRLYTGETKLGSLMKYFSVFAIFIAAMGLFGLTSFLTEQRTKEIGIRKTLGASVSGIYIHLLRDMILWVLLANVIAWPAAYLTMERWLQEYAYRATIGFHVFLLAAGLGLVIAIGSVSYQSMKAALGNPVEALRYE